MTVAVETWHEFCELLKDAGSVLWGMLSLLENPGPRRPEFRSLPAHAGFGLDNPDNVYMSATIDARYDYRHRGSRGTIANLSSSRSGPTARSRSSRARRRSRGTGCSSRPTRR